MILSVVSSETAASFEEMYSPSADSIGRTRTATTDWMMFGFYIRNNVGVAFQCFAGGLFAGLGTLFFLAYNGAFAGALAGYLTERGLSSTFYSFIATHSAFELTAIVLSGAAGLRIGHALLAPGRLTRLQSLVLATRDSAVLLYGVTAHAAGRRRHRGLLVVRELAARGRQVRRRRCLLDRGARVFRLPGTTCRLTRSRCACGRGRRWKPPISACVSARAPRAPSIAATRIVALPVAALALASFELASWLPTAGDLVRETVARSHDPLRPVARRLRAANHTGRRVEGAAAGVVEPVAVHVDGPAPVAVAIAHAAGLPARRALDLEGAARAFARSGSGTWDPR